MKIVGGKFSHDSAISMIEDGKLIFSVEGEKLDNNARYKKAGTVGFLPRVLRAEYIDIKDCELSFDGWHKNTNLAEGVLETFEYGTMPDEINDKKSFDCLGYKYDSYSHITGHILSSYMTSEFSKNNENAYCVVWDGGVNAKLYHVCPDSKRISYVDELVKMTSEFYLLMCVYWGKYKLKKIPKKRDRMWGIEAIKKVGRQEGKIMAYISNGKEYTCLKQLIGSIYDSIKPFDKSKDLSSIDNHLKLEFQFIDEIYKQANTVYTDADILLNIHTVMGEVYVDSLIKNVPCHANLVLSGGSALNIKWNSSIKKYFPKMWIPPFPNDSGSAIGASCAVLAFKYDIWTLDWSVYSGPNIIDSGGPNNWNKFPMTAYELGQFVARNPDDCVVVISGRAEVGPRALGHRSIIMSPVGKNTKKYLNKVKNREKFRPVAPMCLLDSAKKAFNLVIEDEYMLYDHTIKDDWKDIIPAIMHIDNTARVQIIHKSSSLGVYEMLEGFKSITGFGIVCNTSANYNGRGFFPDTFSAMHWANTNDVKYVYSNGFIYRKDDD